MGPICAIDIMEKGPVSWVSYKLDFLENKKIVSAFTGLK